MAKKKAEGEMKRSVNAIDALVDAAPAPKTIEEWRALATHTMTASGMAGAEDLELDDDDYQRFGNVVWALERFTRPAHQVGGHARDIQAPMEPELQPEGDWRLVLQVDSDDELGMMWGDLGRLYLWARTEDLAAGRFDRFRLRLQCT